MAYDIEVRRKVGKKITVEAIKKDVSLALRKAGAKKAEISVALVGGGEIKKWNSYYRGKKKVTDVLSFLYEQKPAVIGEIIVCYPRAVEQAKERGWSTGEEIKFLLVHGALHLVGYDHEKNEREAARMDKMQKMIMGK